MSKALDFEHWRSLHKFMTGLALNQYGFDDEDRFSLIRLYADVTIDGELFEAGEYEPAFDCGQRYAQ